MKQNVKTVSGRKETTDQPKKKTKVEEYVVNPDKVLKFTRGTRVKTKVSMRSYSLTQSSTVIKQPCYKFHFKIILCSTFFEIVFNFIVEQNCQNIRYYYYFSRGADEFRTVAGEEISPMAGVFFDRQQKKCYFATYRI